MARGGKNGALRLSRFGPCLIQEAGSAAGADPVGDIAAPRAGGCLCLHRGKAVPVLRCRDGDDTAAVGVVFVAGIQHIGAGLCKGGRQLAVLIGLSQLCPRAEHRDVGLGHGGGADHLVDRHGEFLIRPDGKGSLVEPDIVLIAVEAVGSVGSLVGKHAVYAAVSDGNGKGGDGVVLAADKEVLSPIGNGCVGRLKGLVAVKRLDIPAAADGEGIAFAETKLHCFRHGLVGGRNKGAVHGPNVVHACQADGHRHCCGWLLTVGVGAVRSENGHGGGDGLSCKLGEIVIIPLAGNGLGIFCVGLMLQNALHRDGGIVLRNRQQQVLMGDDRRSAGLEFVVLLLSADFGVVRHVAGDDAGLQAVVHRVGPAEGAVGIARDLLEGVQALGDAVAGGVGTVIDAVPIVGLDVVHQHQGGIQFLHRQRHDRQLDGLADAHGLFPVLHGDREGHGSCLLIGHGLVDHRPVAVDPDDRLVIGGNGEAVGTVVLDPGFCGPQELNIPAHRKGINGLLAHEVGEFFHKIAVVQRLLHLRPQRLQILGRNGQGEGRQLQRAFAQGKGQGGRQGDGSVLRRGAHLGRQRIGDGVAGDLNGLGAAFPGHRDKGVGGKPLGQGHIPGDVVLIFVFAPDGGKGDALGSFGKVFRDRSFVPFQIHRDGNAAALAAQREQELDVGDRRAVDSKGQSGGVGAEIGDAAVLPDARLTGDAGRMGEGAGLGDGDGDAGITPVFQKRLHIGAQVGVLPADRGQAATAVKPGLDIGQPLLILGGEGDDGDDEGFRGALTGQTDGGCQGDVGGALRRKGDRAVGGDDALVAALPTDRAVKALGSGGKRQGAVLGDGGRGDGQSVLHRRDGCRRDRVGHVFAALPGEEGIAAVGAEMIGGVAQEQDEITGLHLRFFLRGGCDRHAVADVADGGVTAAGKVIAVFHRAKEVAGNGTDVVGGGACSGDGAGVIAVFDARRLAHGVPCGNARDIVRAADGTCVVAIFYAAVAVVRIADDARDLAAVAAAAGDGT